MEKTLVLSDVLPTPDYVYRVDFEYNTLDKTPVNILIDCTPIEVVIPTMIGNGTYCYFLDFDKAKQALINNIKTQIEELQQRLKHIK